MEVKGRIHSYESAGAVDGPGIRFVVFMQGCTFRCKYCHNPDSWNENGGTERTVSEVLNEILKYRNFIAYSNGGVTVTGGEPMLQKKFAAELFKALKEEGISTALDTSGFADLDEDTEDVLKNTDLVLLDVKHLDTKRHEKLTGKGVEKTFAFLNHLRKKKIKTWIRWVIVPELNDTDADAKKYADFVKKYDNVELVELLPYHDMGAYKWKRLGLKYPLLGVPAPTKERMDAIIKILEGNGIKTLNAS